MSVIPAILPDGRLNPTTTSIRDARGRTPRPARGWSPTAMALNILSVFDDAADSSVRIEGRAWYAAAAAEAARLSAAYGRSVEVCAGVLAALSPRNKWSRNVADAAAMVAAHAVGGAAAAAEVKVCTFGANKAKALAILGMASPAAAEVSAVLSGRKLRSFYACILGDESNVCVDGHAVAIALGERIPLDSTPSLSASRYASVQAAYNIAADARGVTGAEMQAVTWVAWRRLHNIA